MELFEQIRREYEHAVGTIQGVARKFGVHQRMVREAIESALPRDLGLTSFPGEIGCTAVPKAHIAVDWCGGFDFCLFLANADGLPVRHSSTFIAAQRRVFLANSTAATSGARLLANAAVLSAVRTLPRPAAGADSTRALVRGPYRACWSF